MVAKKTQQISVLMNPRCFLRALDLVVSSQLENILSFSSLLGTSYSHHNDTAVSVVCHTHCSVGDRVLLALGIYQV